MLVEHTLIVQAKCPINGLRDVYEVCIRLERLVLVEDLLLAVDRYADKAVLQEELTQQLADLFRCEVESRGSHSKVRTRVVCRHADPG